MNRRAFLKSCASVIAAVQIAAPAVAGERRAMPDRAKSSPNIVFILADDMGYGDIRAYNPKSEIPTPNLNRLAGEGMRFTDAHSGSAVCTPTRYGLLTGRYCWRTRLKSGVLFPPNDKPLIEKERLTVAGMLGRHGYHTACIGKWHLGIDWAVDDRGSVDFNKPIRYGPTDVGFDEFFGIAASLDMVPYAFYRNREPVRKLTDTQQPLPFPRFIRKGPKAPDFDPGKVLDELTGEAESYIEKRAVEKTPFFLYLALTAPHKPVWPAPRFTGKTKLGPYGDFVHQADDSVGRVLRALQKAGIEKNTIVFFSSDNGSYMYSWPQEKEDHTKNPRKQGYNPENHRPNADFRGTKADIWEAGHRVPFIVRWPGTVKPAAKCDKTICLTDFLATCAEIIGHDIPPNAAEDSFSLVPLLHGRDCVRPPVIHHSANGTFAVRDGKWKMVFADGSGGREKPPGKPFRKPYSLFDIQRDPSETANLIDQYPQIAERLEKELSRIRQPDTP
ncbi:MAG: sulfatase-like hydrolase/transferase [Sedimentisphaerales bacterium]|nr:sulfatase-like hydrolase/transferase [Sedimentisphaerales bacterium]